MNLLETQVLYILFQLDNEVAAIRQFLMRYRSVPMSIADACLVRMAELYPNHSVLTLDGDFTIYRKNRNQLIPTIAPTAL